MTDTEKLQKAIELLEKKQFISNFNVDYGYCIWCYELAYVGHKKDCELISLLKECKQLTRFKYEN